MGPAPKRTGPIYPAYYRETKKGGAYQNAKRVFYH
jgi:hypothetical protein